MSKPVELRTPHMKEIVNRISLMPYRDLLRLADKVRQHIVVEDVGKDLDKTQIAEALLKASDDISEEFNKEGN